MSILVNRDNLGGGGLAFSQPGSSRDNWSVAVRHAAPQYGLLHIDAIVASSKYIHSTSNRTILIFKNTDHAFRVCH